MMNLSFIENIEAIFRAVLTALLIGENWSNADSSESKLALLDELQGKIDQLPEYARLKKALSKQEILNQGDVKTELGMNTPGLLLDRLSILVCKAFLSSNPGRGLADEQIKGVGLALSSSGLSPHNLLEKEQVETAHVKPRKKVQLIDTMIELHFSNIAMWINQDLLYTRDPENASCDRLRDYISFFKKSNSRRNESIAIIDESILQLNRKRG